MSSFFDDVNPLGHCDVINALRPCAPGAEPLISYYYYSSAWYIRSILIYRCSPDADMTVLITYLLTYLLLDVVQLIYLYLRNKAPATC